MALASNPVYHARTKHIELDYHFIREKVLNKDISIQFISTHDQPADIFTKGLSLVIFLFVYSKLMIFLPPIRLRGDVNQDSIQNSTSPNAMDSIQNSTSLAATITQG
jgi:hypothetical protein